MARTLTGSVEWLAKHYKIGRATAYRWAQVWRINPKLAENMLAGRVQINGRWTWTNGNPTAALKELRLAAIESQAPPPPAIENHSTDEESRRLGAYEHDLQYERDKETIKRICSRFQTLNENAQTEVLETLCEMTTVFVAFMTSPCFERKASEFRFEFTMPNGRLVRDAVVDAD